MFEQIIDKQKLSRMMDRSERIYLKRENMTKANKSVYFFNLQLDEIAHHHVVAAYAPEALQLPP